MIEIVCDACLNSSSIWMVERKREREMLVRLELETIWLVPFFFF